MGEKLTARRQYVKHAKEANLELPTVPILFLCAELLPRHPPSLTPLLSRRKPATSLTGPFPAPIVIPKFTIADKSADYESELGVIISKDCKDVSEEDALDYVLGYTATNDVSSRKSQFEQSQWGFSKGFDKACPTGEFCVPRVSDAADPF